MIPIDPAFESLVTQTDLALSAAEGPILLAVSGGVDSMVLAHWVAHHIPNATERIQWVHVDHQIRDASAADAAWVGQIAAAWGFPCTHLKGNALALAKTQHRSLEDAARQLRYQLIKSCADSLGAQDIWTAHHLNDQAETVLLHLLRGSGLQGLSGMPHRAPYPLDHEGSSLTLWRPMLRIPRAEIERYAAAHEVPYRTDPSNASDEHMRNRIRHHLIPALSSYNPAIAAQLGRLASIVEADLDTLNRVYRHHFETGTAHGRGWVRLSRQNWDTVSIGYQRALIRSAVSHITGTLDNLTFDQTEAVRAALQHPATGQQFDVQKGIVTAIYYDQIIFALPNQLVDAFDLPQLPSDDPIAIPRDTGISISLKGNWRVTTHRSPIDIDPVWVIELPQGDQFSWMLRGRKPGEKFSPAGLNGHMSLKDLMIDRKLPQPLRDRWPLLCNQQGDVVWLPGLRKSDQIPEHSGDSIWVSIQKW